MKDQDIRDMVQHQIQRQPIKNRWGDFIERVPKQKQSESVQSADDERFVTEIPEDFKRNKRRGRKRKRAENKSPDKLSGNRNGSFWEQPKSSGNAYGDQAAMDPVDEGYQYQQPPTKKMKRTIDSEEGTLLQSADKEEQDDDEWNWNVWDNEKTANHGISEDTLSTNQHGSSNEPCFDRNDGNKSIAKSAVNVSESELKWQSTVQDASALASRMLQEQKRDAETSDEDGIGDQVKAYHKSTAPEHIDIVLDSEDIAHSTMRSSRQVRKNTASKWDEFE